MPSQQHFPKHKIRGTGKAKVTLKLEHNAKNIGKEIKIFVPQMKLESREIKVKQAPSFFSSSTSLSFLLAFFFVFYIYNSLSFPSLSLSSTPLSSFSFLLSPFFFPLSLSFSLCPYLFLSIFLYLLLFIVFCLFNHPPLPSPLPSLFISSPPPPPPGSKY